MSKARKYILSLDGGGFRALSSLIILDHIMRMLVDDPGGEPIPSPYQVFDLICGTSTGGIVAILLGRLGLGCSEAITIYKNLGPKIFQGKEMKVLDHIVAGDKFSPTAFEDFLKEEVKQRTDNPAATMKVQKDTAGRRTTDVFVTTVSAGIGSAGTEAYRLRSYTKPREGIESAPPNHSWTICQAVRATSAAPMYFMPLRIGSHAFQDAAASGFNNPTSEALQEAELRWPSQAHEFVVVSLGTGLASLIRDHPGGKEGTTMERENAPKPVALREIIEQLELVARDTESKHRQVADCFAKWNRPNDYFRFNPPQGLGDLDLVDYTNEGIIIEITNVWLRSPKGRDSTLAVYKKLRSAYDARKNEFKAIPTTMAM